MTHLRFSLGFPLAVRFDLPRTGEDPEDDGVGVVEEEDEVVVAAIADCFCFWASAAASIVSIRETIFSPEIQNQHRNMQDLSMWRFLLFFCSSYRGLFQHFLRLFVAVVVLYCILFIAITCSCFFFYEN